MRIGIHLGKLRWSYQFERWTAPSLGRLQRTSGAGTRRYTTISDRHRFSLTSTSCQRTGSYTK
jgi:hypothetical protein